MVIMLFYLLIGTSAGDGTRTTISIFDTLPGDDLNGAAWSAISIGVGLFGQHAWEAAAAATWYANDDQRLPKTHKADDQCMNPAPHSTSSFELNLHADDWHMGAADGYFDVFGWGSSMDEWTPGGDNGTGSTTDIWFPDGGNTDGIVEILEKNWKTLLQMRLEAGCLERYLLEGQSGAPPR